MHDSAILLPIFALALWTALVLLLIPYVRVGAAKRHEVRAHDFKFGESENVPGYVSIPNRNYMNLLELPVLFYVICIIVYVTGNSSSIALYLAWSYVALRIIHSLIHLTYNRVVHRLFAFALSNAALVALWMHAATSVFARP
jgi:hypothetical protein